MKRVGQLTPALRALASHAGVQASYVGFDQRKHLVDPDVLVAVLAAIGVPIERPEGAGETLALMQAQRARHLLDPVIAVRVDEDTSASIPVPEGTDPARCRLLVTFEDGRMVSKRVGELLVPSDAGPRMCLPQAPDGGIPAGYHEVTLEGPTFDTQALLVAAPRCPPPQRGWGLFSPLYAVRTDADWGVGSYGDLGRLGVWMHSLGGSLVSTLPLYPTFPAEPSPYLPVTRLGYNELYVDPTVIGELADAPAARQVLQSSAFASRIEAARRCSEVPYEELVRLRRQVIEPLADAIVGEETGAGLYAFAAEHPELLDYARFRAVTESFGRDRRSWSGLARDKMHHLSLDDPVVRYHLCAQWLAFRQLAEAAPHARLLGDLPIGVHPDGFDPFFEPDAFAIGAHGGAPPDLFYAGGQDWSFPPPHPVGMRAQRYRYFIKVLRRAFSHARAVRIDHIMGLHRLYWVPVGYDAQHGAYVSYPANELHALVALEAHRCGALVVGEDLGTVESSVRRDMARDGMLRSWVFQFETTPKDPLPEPPEHCVASLGTHDTPRFAGFFRGATAGEMNRTEDLLSDHPPHAVERAHWRGALAQALRVRGLPKQASLDPSGPVMSEKDAALAGCLLHLASSKADLVLADLGDLVGQLEQENRPGQVVDGSNWSRRSSLTLREIRDDPQVVALLTLMEEARALDRERGKHS